MTNKRGRNNHQSVIREQRLAQVAEMLNGGLTQAEIAKALQVGTDVISKDVKKLRAIAREKIGLNTTEHLAAEIADLEETEKWLKRELWVERARVQKLRKAGTDAKMHLGPLQYILDVKDRRIRLLGLNDTRAAREAAAAHAIATEAARKALDNLDGMTASQMDAMYDNLVKLAVDNSASVPHTRSHASQARTAVSGVVIDVDALEDDSTHSDDAIARYR
jgi:transposase-like protein